MSDIKVSHLLIASYGLKMKLQNDERRVYQDECFERSHLKKRIDKESAGLANHPLSPENMFTIQNYDNEVSGAGVVGAAGGASG